MEGPGQAPPHSRRPSLPPRGSAQEVTADVRVIAATNQDLQTYVRQKKFREDLYYRLSVFELFVPPLRERGSDINLLVNHFLDHFRRQHGRPHWKCLPKRAKNCSATTGQATSASSAT